MTYRVGWAIWTSNLNTYFFPFAFNIKNPLLWYTATLCYNLGTLLLTTHQVAVYHSSTDKPSNQDPPW